MPWDHWNTWMNEKWDAVNATNQAPKPMQVMVSEWIIAVFLDFPACLIRRAWMKDGYIWMDKRAEDGEEEEEEVGKMILLLMTRKMN